jgi:hypothetical protein
MFLESFDAESISSLGQRWMAVNNGAIGTGGRFGGSCFQISGTNNNPTVSNLMYRFVSTSSLSFGFSFKQSTAYGGFQVVLTNSGTIAYTIQVNYLNQVYITNVATGASLVIQTTLVPGNWHHIDCTLASISLDGSTAQSVPGPPQMVNEIILYLLQYSNGIPSAYDDIYIAPGSTTAYSDLAVVCLKPDAAGAYTQWTPSTGANWQNVDDSTPDDDGTYNQATTVNDIDSFAVSQPTNSLVNIAAVQVSTRTRKTAPNARVIANTMKVGGSIYVQAGSPVTDNYSDNVVCLALRPSDNLAWQMSDIAALETGYKLIS